LSESGDIIEHHRPSRARDGRAEYAGRAPPSSLKRVVGQFDCGRLYRLEKQPDEAHIRRMARWLKIALVVSGIFGGWVILSVLTFDDGVKIDAGEMTRD
jgi:hypothetical protein